jgi:hypothetical protein
MTLFSLLGIRDLVWHYRLALVMLLYVAVFGVACSGPVPVLLPPDPCVLTSISLVPLQEINLPEPGDGIRILVDNGVWERLPDNAQVALIVNGNGYSQQDYEDLAEFLARNGFIAVIAHRPTPLLYPTPAAFVVDALQATFAELGLDGDTPVALIGHSVGGQVVVNTAIYNQDTEAGYNIQAVVGLAPNAADIGHLTGDHTPAYLLIYGSQDEDVEGDAMLPAEAFAAYDLAGMEDSTTCNTPPCLQLYPPFERIMIYIHGAGHAGLINSPGGGCLQDQCDPISAYLSPADQFCIAKGYTNAFLRWKLRGETVNKLTARGDYTPPSIAAITSDAPDYKGNPAGSPLRLAFQVSPVLRRSVENFQDEQFDLFAVSPDVVHQLAGTDEHSDPPNYVRHQTRYLLVGWPNRDEGQHIGLNTPPNVRNTTHFSHLGLRLGQFGGAPFDYENPFDTEQSIQICLGDGRQFSCEWSHVWGTIPPNDPQPDDVAHSVMNTISIPLGAFQGIDRSNVEAVLFLLPPDSQGTLMVDSIEWFLD